MTEETQEKEKEKELIPNLSEFIKQYNNGRRDFSSTILPYDEEDKPLRRLTIKDCDFTNCEYEHQDYFGCGEYEQIEFHNCNFSNAFYCLNIYWCKFINCKFQNIETFFTEGEKNEFINCDFSNSNLEDTSMFYESKIVSCNFIHCRFNSRTYFEKAEITDCDFRFTTFDKVDRGDTLETINLGINVTVTKIKDVYILKDNQNTVFLYNYFMSLDDFLVTIIEDLHTYKEWRKGTY